MFEEEAGDSYDQISKSREADSVKDRETDRGQISQKL